METKSLALRGFIRKEYLCARLFHLYVALSVDLFSMSDQRNMLIETFNLISLIAIHREKNEPFFLTCKGNLP